MWTNGKSPALGAGHHAGSSPVIPTMFGRFPNIGSMTFLIYINKNVLMNYVEIIKDCYSYSDFCRELNISLNGSGMKKVKKIIENHNLDISHFNKGYNKRIIKYEKIEKICPICEKSFTTSIGNRDEKTTCSHSCSNTYFRSGLDNGNWKESHYRTTCFLYHKKECIICKESKIVEVHHLDENKLNNIPSNLIPLCPTHHQYWHSRYKNEIEDKVYNYIKDFIEENS